jgi:hypothetical protein
MLNRTVRGLVFRAMISTCCGLLAWGSPLMAQQRGSAAGRGGSQPGSGFHNHTGGYHQHQGTGYHNYHGGGYHQHLGTGYHRGSHIHSGQGYYGGLSLGIGGGNFSAWQGGYPYNYGFGFPAASYSPFSLGYGSPYYNYYGYSNSYSSPYSSGYAPYANVTPSVTVIVPRTTLQPTVRQLPVPNIYTGPFDATGAPTGTLLPGMVLPDGSIVRSVDGRSF